VFIGALAPIFLSSLCSAARSGFVRLSVEPSVVFRKMAWPSSTGVESCGFWAVVDQTPGRSFKPVRQTARYYAGSKNVLSKDIPLDGRPGSLKGRAHLFDEVQSSFEVRVELALPAHAHVDKIVYSLELREAGGATDSESISIPISDHVNTTNVRCPLLGTFRLAQPSDAMAFDWTLGYGYNLIPVHLRDNFVRAGADGVVLYASHGEPDGKATKQNPLGFGSGLGGALGNAIFLDHADGEFTLYAFMKQGSVKLRVGEHVRQGDVIGEVGASGEALKPQLLFAIYTRDSIFRSPAAPGSFFNVRAVSPGLWGTK
jgi:hypothetical protein